MMLKFKRSHLVVFLLIATLAVSWVLCTHDDKSSKDVAPAPIPIQDTESTIIGDEEEEDDEEDFVKLEELKELPNSGPPPLIPGSQGSSYESSKPPPYGEGAPSSPSYPASNYSNVAYQSAPQVPAYAGQSYQQPEAQSYASMANYSAPIYQSIGQVSNYSLPNYQPPSYEQNYQQAQVNTYPNSAPTYAHQPATISNYSTLNYQTPVIEQSYQPTQSYKAPVAPQTYQQAPIVNYSVPIYQAPLQQTYQPSPQVNYSAPSYQATYQPQVNYSAPAYQAPVLQHESYQPAQDITVYPAPAYQAPAPAPAPTYQGPAPAPTYQAPAPAPTYQAPAPAPTYQAPAPAPTYQAPAPAPTYQAPAPAPTYQAPAPAPTYQTPAPAPTYQAAAPAPTYQTPAPAPTYQAPAPAPTYQAPAPAPAPTYQASPKANYSAPVYQPPQQSYQPAVLPQKPAPVANNYTAPQQYGAKPASQSYQKPIQSVNYQVAKPPVAPQYPLKYQQASAGNYSAMSNLNSIVNMAGYKANHWSLHYYKPSPNYICPKANYMMQPSPRDIVDAFNSAQQQLLQIRGNTVSYINSTHHSFAARHALFSFLSQVSPRMDEEGLLTEAVSLYLASRYCMTKWDKQRYLPQLTKLVSTGNYPGTHSCALTYQKLGSYNKQLCAQSKYRTFDGFCNNIYHPYWGKSNVCHIRLLSPDYADGISAPRVSLNPMFPLPNPRAVSNYIHHEVPLEGLYNLMKMQWGQFINHDITNTALSSYDGLVDCCKNPSARGCWPIYVPPGDKFLGKLNVTCLNFIRSGVCPLCQLGPRQQSNKNTAFLDASHIYGNTQEQANKLRTFKGGLLITSPGKNGEELPPIATGSSQDQCSGTCFVAGDNRINQHPTLTALHTLLLRRHNQHARGLYRRHPDWNDEYLFQEARRLTIAEYQMITYGEYLPIVFGPILSAYYKLLPSKAGYTYYNEKVDPTTWNEYSTASCRFGHSQISSIFGIYGQLMGYGQKQSNAGSFRLKDWFMRPSFISDGLTDKLVLGLLGTSADVVDPWITDDVRNHLYKSHKDLSGGDLAATNIWRGRDHGIPAYVHYLEYCFNYKVYGWDDLKFFIPPHVLGELRKTYKVVENVDLFTGGLSEKHFPGADIGPTFACINGIQYYHLKFGDRYYFEHGNQAGSFNPVQLNEIRRSSLARLLCKTAYISPVPQYAFLQVSPFNPAVNCNQLGEIDYNKF